MAEAPTPTLIAISAIVEINLRGVAQLFHFFFEIEISVPLTFQMFWSHLPTFCIAQSAWSITAKADNNLMSSGSNHYPD